MSLHQRILSYEDAMNGYTYFPAYETTVVLQSNESYRKELEQVELKKKQSHNAKLRNRIQRVKFDNPWTIVWWDDGSITRVKCSNLDTFSEEAGLMAAICKHYYEDTRIFGEMLHKWCKPTLKGNQAEDINAAYDAGYDNGYTVGYDEGYSEGQYDGCVEEHNDAYDEGYAIGRSTGYDEGYSQGYHDGKEL